LPTIAGMIYDKYCGILPVNGGQLPGYPSKRSQVGWASFFLPTIAGMIYDKYCGILPVNGGQQKDVAHPTRLGSEFD